jgi:hypothetical protein
VEDFTEGLLKEKSWSIKLVPGFIFQEQERGGHCSDCTGTASIVAYNLGNPNMVLFGCNGSKCQHKLIKLSFGSS